MSGTTYVIGPEDEVDEENPDIVIGEKSTVVAAASEMAESDGDENDLVPDEPEDDEDEVTEIPVHGVLAPEGIPTGDGRMFAVGALTHRDLPLPIGYQLMTSEGHMNAVTVGRIDEIFRAEGKDELRFRGAIVLSKEHAPTVIEGIIDGTVRGISVDVDNAVVEVPESVGGTPEGEAEVDLIEQFLNPGVTVFSEARVAGVTIVPIPAFQEAYLALGLAFEDELTDEDRAALAACGCMADDIVDLSDDPDENFRAQAEFEDGAYREISAEERKRLAKEGKALPDGSFPIANCEDLRNAIQANGRARDIETARAHIKKRARELDCPDIEIPEDWALAAGALAIVGENGVETTIPLTRPFAPGTKDGPGWITHPVPTARIRRYWTKGKGAAKIRWGVPGDFNRCRRQLAKYVARPDWLAGMCANMHYEALGFWPSTHAKAVRGSGTPAPIVSLVASARESYPAEWFDVPRMDHPVALAIEGQHVYGYLAEWGQCHLGIRGVCTEAPKSMANYAWYKRGVVSTTAGDQSVGCLTYGIGHASERMRASAATAHYDQTSAVRAFVNIGEDGHGIWFNGALAPWVGADDITAMRAIGAFSGDWRDVRGDGTLELIGAVCVGVPGLPVPTRIGMEGGKQVSLIASARHIVEAPPVRTAEFTLKLDAEAVAGIARAAVAEMRHLERREQVLAPVRQNIRTKALASARAKIEGKI